VIPRQRKSRTDLGRSGIARGGRTRREALLASLHAGPTGHSLEGCAKQNGNSVYTRSFGMQSGRSSRTAEFMALFRALESTGPPDRRLFDDPFAATFVSTPLRRVVRWSAVPVLGTVLRQIIDHLWPGARSSGVARTRLIDDWIAASIANG